MTPRPRADRTTKRAVLASAALSVFAAKGVANTAVSDIVEAAGVSQGSFYLYFDSKDEVVIAVVEQMAGGIASAIEDATARTDASAVEKLLALCDVLVSFDANLGARELAVFIHRRENRALHDRLTEHLAERLATVFERIVDQGVAEGAFDVPGTKTAAWFVLGGLQSVELSGTPAAQMPAAIDAVMELALHSLGHRGA